MRAIIAIIVSLIAGSVCAQEISKHKVLFHCPKQVELSTRLTSTELNRILIDKNSTIRWLDGHDIEKHAFAIKSVTGSLQLDKSGAVIYQVTSEKASGRFTVKKTNALIRITAMLVIEGKPTSLEFEVVSYNVID